MHTNYLLIVYNYVCTYFEYIRDIYYIMYKTNEPKNKSSLVFSCLASFEKKDKIFSFQDGLMKTKRTKKRLKGGIWGNKEMRLL